MIQGKKKKFVMFMNNQDNITIGIQTIGIVLQTAKSQLET